MRIRVMLGDACAREMATCEHCEWYEKVGNSGTGLCAMLRRVRNGGSDFCSRFEWWR